MGKPSKMFDAKAIRGQVRAWEVTSKCSCRIWSHTWYMGPSLRRVFEPFTAWTRWVGAGYERKRGRWVVPDKGAGAKLCFRAAARSCNAEGRLVDVRAACDREVASFGAQPRKDRRILLDDYKFSPFWLSYLFASAAATNGRQENLLTAGQTLLAPHLRRIYPSLCHASKQVVASAVVLLSIGRVRCWR